MYLGYKEEGFDEGWKKWGVDVRVQASNEDFGASLVSGSRMDGKGL